MANTAATKQRLRRWAQQVQRDAATQVTNAVSKATPRYTGQLERARQRRDTTQGNRMVTHLTQPAGPTEPADLPEWLDRNVQFPIRSRRGGPALRFRVRGGRVVFARSVQWRPRPSSVGFWSKNVNAQAWSRALDEAGRKVKF